MRTPRARGVALAGLLLTLVAIAPGARAGSAPEAVARDVPIGGLIRTRDLAERASSNREDEADALRAHRRRRVRNLRYHGGPVMRTHTTHAIYWTPPGSTMSAGYRATIDGYFADVAADSGSTSNVYAVETEYYDTSSSIDYAQTFAGSAIVTDPFPSNGCPAYGGMSVCLTDDQVQAEIQDVVADNAWPVGTSDAYLLFLPRNVGTCVDSGGTTCAFTYFCGYHSATYVGGEPLIYSNVPYAETKASCRVGTGPNGFEADSTINIASHEHREMINDPLIDAWYDVAGNEGSDKCAWRFGATASNGLGNYNQTINGNGYFLQKEWSNARKGCALTSI